MCDLRRPMRSPLRSDSPAPARSGSRAPPPQLTAGAFARRSPCSCPGEAPRSDAGAEEGVLDDISTSRPNFAIGSFGTCSNRVSGAPRHRKSPCQKIDPDRPTGHPTPTPPAQIECGQPSTRQHDAPIRLLGRRGDCRRSGRAPDGRTGPWELSSAAPFPSVAPASTRPGQAATCQGRWRGVVAQCVLYVSERFRVCPGDCRTA